MVCTCGGGRDRSAMYIFNSVGEITPLPSWYSHLYIALRGLSAIVQCVYVVGYTFCDGVGMFVLLSFLVIL